MQGRPDDIGNRTIRRRVTFGQNGFAGGLPIGAIEKGGVPLRAYAIINTPFSKGATVSLGAVANPATGLAANAGAYMGTADIAATTQGGNVVGTGATKPGGPLMSYEAAADTIVYAYLSGTAATAGDVTFIVEYAPAYNWSDLNGGQLP